MNIYQGRTDRGKFATLLQQWELRHQQVGGQGQVEGPARACAWAGASGTQVKGCASA